MHIVRVYFTKSEQDVLKDILEHDRFLENTLPRVRAIAETQEMLNFCARHQVVSDVEIIDIKSINEACEGMSKGDVTYRFAVDSSTLSQREA